MKKSVILLAVAGMATAASAQSFAEYFLNGENLTDAGRGTTNADAGDIIRMSLRVNHDSLSYAGGKAEILYGDVGDGDIVLTEDGFSFPFDPWVIGREPLFRIIASDGPADATRPHNVDIEALAGKITDINADYFDFASTPPGLGGLGAAFPLESGEATFVFDYTYQGGTDSWDAGHNGSARLWRDANDINGAVVDASSGDTFFVTPAPASLALLGLGGLVAGRRRR